MYLVRFCIIFSIKLMFFIIYCTIKVVFYKKLFIEVIINLDDLNYIVYNHKLISFEYVSYCNI